MFKVFCRVADELHFCLLKKNEWEYDETFCYRDLEYNQI
jgi:hypothetical protein